MAVAADRINDIPAHSDRVLRHAGVDRLFHWLTAACVLTLMATGLLPHVGVRFDWVGIHWVAGLTLVALVIFHVLRSAVWRKLRAMWFSIAELRTHQVGKYSVAQKLMHHAMTAMVLGAAITGVLMLKKIRTPLLVRDPYLFDAHDMGHHLRDPRAGRLECHHPGDRACVLRDHPGESHVSARHDHRLDVAR